MAFKAPELKSAPFGRTGSMGPKTMNLQTEGKPPPPKAPKGIRVEHRIGVQAPAEQIWDQIYDLRRWPGWNPLYPQAEGDIRIGGTLALTVAIDGQPPRQIQPVVLDWIPNEQLHWKLSLMGGLIKSIRFIEIEQLGPASCIVNNGELFSGLLAPTALKRMGRSVYRGFAAMNEALKTRAEAAWAAEQG